MAGNQRWDLGWLRGYKLIACVGIGAVWAPVFDLLAFWGAKQYAPFIAAILTPMLLCIGYGIQTLLLGKERAAVHGAEMDFSYESTHVRISRGRLVVACIISAGISAGIGSAVGGLLRHILGSECNAEVGIPLVIVTCMVTGILGCLFVPFRFHQLLSVRTMVECLFVFVILFAIHLRMGNGVNLLFLVCVTLYLLCYTIVMNQEYVIRPSYSSPTCYATGKLRRAGIGSAIRFWLTAWLIAFAFLGILMLFVIPGRAVVFGGQNGSFGNVFGFPFPGFPELNAVIFGGSVAALIASLILVILFFSPYRKDVKRWLQIAVRKFKRLWKICCHFFNRKPSEYIRKKQTEPEPLPAHYVDTVIPTPVREQPRTENSYRAFSRRLKALHGTDAQYRYAYQTLIGALCTTDIGISRTQTPLEMAEIIRNKTTVEEIDELTQVFLNVAYADMSALRAKDADVRQICGILQKRLTP